MRPGWIVSVVLHALLVLVFMMGLPFQPNEPEAIAANVVPVEILTIADISNVAPAAPQDEELQAVEEAAQPEEPEPAPAPVQQAPPPPRQRLDLAALQRDLMQDLQNRDDRNTPRRERGDPSERPRRAVGLSQAESVALRDRIAAIARAHMLRNRCWRAPVDAPNPERLVVTLRFRLDANGRVAGRPQVVSPATTMGDPELRVAVDRAVRAVLQCDPYPFADDRTTADHFEIWREMELRFDPREVAG